MPGPSVNIPSTWQRPQRPFQARPTSPFPQATMGTPASGYSEQHASYGSERERWAKISARLPLPVPPAQTISLEISAVHEGGTRRKGSRGITIGVCILS
jgi:hypothetical protein